MFGTAEKYFISNCLTEISPIKGVLYSILGPDLLGLSVAVLNIVLYRFVEQLDLLLLNQSIKRKF